MGISDSKLTVDTAVKLKMPENEEKPVPMIRSLLAPAKKLILNLFHVSEVLKNLKVISFGLIMKGLTLKFPGFPVFTSKC